MKLIFVDETGDDKFQDYFGICVAIIDANNYGQLKQGFQQILLDSDWDETIEFKGSHLFSASKGDTSVDVNTRVEIAEQILCLNQAKKNARMTFHFGSESGVSDIRETYLQSLPAFLAKVLPRPQKGGRAKNLLALSCDFRNDIKEKEIQEAAIPVLNKKGWGLFEHVVMRHSNFHTVGILFADIVGYLAARIDTIANDAELFENIPPHELEKNGKYRKLTSSTKLLQQIKNMHLYKKVEVMKK